MNCASGPAWPPPGGLDLDTELFINRFVDAVDCEETEAETLTPQTRLDSLENWNSLAALSTIAMIATDYGVEVPGRVLKACESVGDIIDFVAGQGVAKSA